MFQFVILFLLFFLQFIYLPVGISFFEVPKVYGAEIGIFVLLLVSLFVDKFWRWREKKYLLGIVFFIFFLSLYHVFSHMKQNTFWGNPFRMQGTLLLWFFLCLLWVSSLFRRMRFPVFIVGGVFLLQVFLAFWVNSGTLGRAVGSLGEPNSLAGEIVFLWPFCVFGFESGMKNYVIWLRRLQFVLLLFLVGVVIFVSGSRSGLIGFLLQLVLLGFVYICRCSWKWAVIGCLILLLFTYSLPFVEHGNVYENRGEVWQAAIFAGMTHPILGSGFGNVEYSLREENRRLGNHLVGYYVDSSHNVFLDWFVAGGVMGLGLLVVLLGRSIIGLVKSGNKLYLIALFGLLGVLSFNPVSVVLLVAFWWVIGQGWQERNC